MRKPHFRGSTLRCTVPGLGACPGLSSVVGCAIQGHSLSFSFLGCQRRALPPSSRGHCERLSQSRKPHGSEHSQRSFPARCHVPSSLTLRENEFPPRKHKPPLSRTCHFNVNPPSSIQSLLFESRFSSPPHCVFFCNSNGKGRTEHSLRSTCDRLEHGYFIPT